MNKKLLISIILLLTVLTTFVAYTNIRSTIVCNSGITKENLSKVLEKNSAELQEFISKNDIFANSYAKDVSVESCDNGGAVIVFEVCCSEKESIIYKYFGSQVYGYKYIVKNI